MDSEIELLQTVKSVLKLTLDREPTSEEVFKYIIKNGLLKESLKNLMLEVGSELDKTASGNIESLTEVRDPVEPWSIHNIDKGI